ncbi:MAG: cadmium-translocating P-type ATPase [Ruminococcus sp.]|nr:cadmium-translocating P-type ATPase [Ruminococcus sp.]
MEKATLKIFNIQNLDCAHCASKIEKAIGELEEVEEAVIVFTSKKFRIKAYHSDVLFEKIVKKCNDIEPGVVLTEENNHIEKDNDAHHETHCCGCHGHEHNHTDTDIHHKHDHKNKEKRDGLKSIALGALLFITAFFINRFTYAGVVSALIYIIAYIILGGRIVLDAVNSIFHKKIFNEKFLMSLATISAFMIGDFAEAVAVMLFFRVGDFFEKRAVETSRNKVMSAVDMRPETVNVMYNDQTVPTPAEKVKKGQTIIVRAGDRIPLDSIVAEGNSSIDTSSVTGEHIPVDVGEGDSVLSGCVNLNGVLKLTVTNELSESMVSKIINSVENAAAGKPKIDRFVTRFAGVYTPIVVLLALITAIVPSLITHDWHKWIYTAVTFLVISCPCAIVLSVPLTFFAGIGASSARGILFKSGLSIEALTGVKALVADKTGTITNGAFSVSDITVYNNTEENELIALCASCEAFSNHPVSKCIVEKAKTLGIDTIEPDSIKEYAGMGIEAYISGKKILCGNEKLMLKEKTDLSGYVPASDGTDILCALNGKLIGCFRITDTLKPDSIEAISALRSSGICTIMLTGDSEGSAAATAGKAGIDRFFAKLLPEDKLTKLRELRKEYGSVMFVGDGVNDAPVLAGADVSAAMGSGADAAIEAADIVIMNSDMSSVSKAFAIARDTNRTAKQNIVFALLFKAAVMILGLAGFANMWFAVFADTGVSVLCVLNSIRILGKRY